MSINNSLALPSPPVGGGGQADSVSHSVRIREWMMQTQTLKIDVGRGNRSEG
jgi:hypothetical protein